jgi:prolyl oligopeptidase
MRMRATTVWCWFLCGCGTATPAAVAPLPQAPPSVTVSPTNNTLPAELVRLNEAARAGASEDVLGELHIADPYRALEEDSPATQAWLAAQSAYTEEALSKLRDPQAEARLQALLSIGSIGEIALGGERVFFTLREAPRERHALYMIDAAKPGALPAQTEAGSCGACGAGPAAAAVIQPVIAPETYGERAAIDYFAPSHDGRYVAFGVSENGDERAVLRVYDVEHKQLLPDTIAHAKWSSVEWLNDNASFYYRRYPKEGEAHWNDKEPDSYFSQLYFHVLGKDTAADPLVWQSAHAVDFPSATVDSHDRYVVFNNTRSWTASDVYLWDRGATAGKRAPAPKPSELEPVVRELDNLTHGLVVQGQLYLMTNIDAPKQRVVKVPVAQAKDRAQWKTLVPETEATIEDSVITHSFIVVHRIRDVHSVLELYDLNGQALGEIALPGRGSVDGLTGALEHDRIAFQFSSYLSAPTLLACDLRTRKVEPLYRVKHDFAAAEYEELQASVPSADGTPINVYYVQRRGAQKNGQNPVLINGYGGFDVSLLPAFSRSPLYFLERGGIYAQANLRGGGEFGEAWHRAGMLKNKLHVFEDFEAVVRWFTSSGISNPNKIAITGGSNGGLLMGALITRAPSTFRAATAYVGLFDMLRYHKFPPAALWISEYGDPSDPETARYLLSYSPYHNVKDHTAYPGVLIETADHDTRVFWGHSAKFAARLQSANAGDHPIYFYVEKAVGHGRGTGIADQVRRYARQYTFLQHELDMH